MSVPDRICTLAPLVSASFDPVTVTASATLTRSASAVTVLLSTSPWSTEASPDRNVSLKLSWMIARYTTVTVVAPPLNTAQSGAGPPVPEAGTQPPMSRASRPRSTCSAPIWNVAVVCPVVPVATTNEAFAAFIGAVADAPPLCSAIVSVGTKPASRR